MTDQSASTDRCHSSIRMRRRFHRWTPTSSSLAALSRRIMLNLFMPFSLMTVSLLLVSVVLSSLMSSSLAKPLVDPGVFVIEGVSSCRNGAGYCVLGTKCSVDGDFVDDDEFGHCDGLRNAFSPSALFVCCKYIGEDADAVAKAKTKMSPVQSYLFEKIEQSKKPGAVVHLVEVLDVVTDSTGVLDVVTRPFEGTQEEFLKQPANARPPKFNVTWLEAHLAALAAGGAAAPASTLLKDDLDSSSSPIFGPFQHFLANNNVRKVRAAKIRLPNHHGFVLTAIKTEKKQQHAANQAYLGDDDVDENLSERIVHDLPSSDVGVGPVDDPILIRFPEDPLPALDDEEEPDFGDLLSDSPDGEQSTVEPEKITEEPSSEPTSPNASSSPTPTPEQLPSSPLPIMMNHPEMLFDIGRPRPSRPVASLPQDVPLVSVHNDLPLSDEDDDSIVVFDDEAFGPEGIPPDEPPKFIIAADDLGPIIHFPGAELPMGHFPLPVNQTSTTSTTTTEPTTTPAEEETTTEEVTETVSTTSAPQATTTTIPDIELTTTEDEPTTTETATEAVEELSSTSTTETTTVTDETTTSASTVELTTTEQTTLATQQAEEEETTTEAVTSTVGTTEADEALTATDASTTADTVETTTVTVETTTVEEEVVTEAPTTTESSLQEQNVTGDLVIVFPNNTVPIHQGIDQGPQISFPPVGLVNDEDEVGEVIVTTEEPEITTESVVQATTEAQGQSTVQEQEETTVVTTDSQAATTEQIELTTQPEVAEQDDAIEEILTTLAEPLPSSTQGPTTTFATAVDDGTTIAEGTTEPEHEETSEAASTEATQTTTAATADVDQATTVASSSEAPETTTASPTTESEVPESTTATPEEIISGLVTTTIVPAAEEDVTTTEAPQDSITTSPPEPTTTVSSEEPSANPEVTTTSSTAAPTTPLQPVTQSSPTTIELFEAPTKLPHPLGQFEEGDEVTEPIDVPELISPPTPNESSGEVEMVTTVPIDSMIKPQQCGIHGRYLTLPESRALRINALDYLRGAPEARFGSYIHGLGGPSQARIIGGRVTSTVIWCWMAAFMAKNPGAGQDTFLCSGALIENDLVISTASCLKKLFDRGLSNFRVVLGDSNLKVNLDLDNNKVVQARDIQEVIIHENYGMDKGIPLNDIGIAKLAQPIEITPTVCLLCLPTETRDFSHKYCTVTGYGKSVFDDSSIRNTQYIDEFSEGVLRQASLPIMAEEDCSSTVYNTSRRHATAVHPSLLCTGGLSGQVACIKSLDAGSPLACHDENGQYVLAGVLSYNLDCGRPLPSLYTRVSTFLRWVRINYMRMLGFIIDNELVKP